MKNLSVAMFALVTIALAASASAQTMQWTDKGYITVNGGAQTGSHNLDTTSTFTLYDEQATVTSTQKVKSGGFFDIGAAYRVWGRNVLAGVSYSHSSSKSDVSLTAKLPDPRFFDQPRTVSLQRTGAKHSENAVHLSAIWMMPVANKLDVGISAGPSIFSVKQQSIFALTAADITESGNFASPNVNAPLGEAKKTTVGFNAGVDVQYMIAKKWGVGGLARYTRGSASIGGASKKLTLGGFQIGGGARLRF